MHRLIITSLIVASAPIRGSDISRVGHDSYAHFDGALYTLAQSGTMPIILTAPHGGRLALEGIEERVSGTTIGDVNTMELVQATSDALDALTGKKPYVVAARFSRKYIDANRSKRYAYENKRAQQPYEFYHHQIAEYSKDIRAKFPAHHPQLIDVHGQGSAPETIFRGTGDKKTVQKLIATHGERALTGPESILGMLAQQKCRVVPELDNPDLQEHNSFNGGFTVHEYGSHRNAGIDAMQLEFGRSFRKPENINNTGLMLAVAIAAFNKKWQMIDECKD